MGANVQELNDVRPVRGAVQAYVRRAQGPRSLRAEGRSARRSSNPRAAASDRPPIAAPPLRSSSRRRAAGG